ncbi:MAG: response regulator [Deltaproteobacteria bacterium]|nr:response regulator [Deltaproteobacteria bacterium]
MLPSNASDEALGTIVLADDEPHLRTLVRTTLEDPRYRILEASSGTAALELARSTRPDPMVLDLMMPGMNGLEVLRCLRAEAETADRASVAPPYGLMSESLATPSLQKRVARRVGLWTSVALAALLVELVLDVGARRAAVASSPAPCRSEPSGSLPQAARCASERGETETKSRSG